MKNSYLLLLFISLFYGCENDTNSNQLLSPDNISSQFFQISIASDTIIQTQGGTILEISKNTFASNSGSVKLEVKEVLTKADIVQSGLFTVAENNEILESDGMLYLDVKPKQEPLKDIKIKMPTGALNPDMQLFELGDDNLWKNPQPLLESPESKRIALGQQLYKKECATCHSENLREDMTGPALGNVHLFRTEKWLLDFTLNSSQMIRNLDSLSICIWNNWKPTAMISFEGVLSEEDISDIYFFIENESKLQEIEKNEVEYIVECHVTYTGSPDDPKSKGWGVSGVEAKTNQGNITVVKDTRGSLLNIFAGKKLGWTNIDYFLRNDFLSERIETFEVKLSNEENNVYPIVLLVLKKRNVVLHLYSKNSEGNFAFPEDYQLILPKEEATIIALDANYAYVSKKILIEDTNFHTLRLEPKSKEEFSKLIKNL